MAGQTPPKRRYVTRVFGVYSNGTYRRQYVQRVPLYTEGGPLHTRATVTPGGDAYLFIEGQQASVATGTFASAGAGDVQIEGYAPSIGAELTVAVGAGEVTISGGQVGSGSSNPQSEAYLTQIHTYRVVTGSGVHRRASYRVVRRVLPLTTAATSTGIGAGSITITGFAPTVSAVEGILVLPGVGNVEIQGQQIGRVLQDLTYTGIWRIKRIRTVVGTGVHRRDVYRTVREFLYFRTYPLAREIEAGSGAITVTGYQIILDPWNAAVGGATVTITGFTPNITADNAPVDVLSPGARQAMFDARKRRRMIADYAQAYPEQIPYEKRVVEYVVPRPQRIIGVPNATLTVVGYQATLQKRVPASVGGVSIDGGQIAVQIRTRSGVATVSVEGYPPSLTGDIQQDVSVGGGDVSVIGYNPTLAGPVLAFIVAGSGTVEIDGSQVSIDTEFSVVSGVGDVVVEGYAPTISVHVSVGAGDVSLVGYTPIPNIELGVVNPGPGEIRIQNLQIGISTPEKASNPGVGTVVYLGNSPNVIATGHWEQTAGASSSWSQTSGASLSWSKVANGGGSWNKL